jgi:pimeloyl-ACP methyl ester carboxylesterase
MTVRHESFRFDGLQVPVEIHGRGEPVIFLPGLGVHPGYYRDGMTRLGQHFTVFVPDLSFRTHADLPAQVDRYREFAEVLAERHAPQAFRAGHSYGGFLALLGSVPAIALSPLIPLRVGLGRKFGRAVRLQLREYLGFEGRRGAGWAWNILRDYLGTAVLHPTSLFPTVSETLHCIAHSFRPTAPRAHIILAEYDRLYLPAETETFVARSKKSAVVVRRVPRGHGWPVTHPELLETEVLQAVRATRAA